MASSESPEEATSHDTHLLLSRRAAIRSERQQRQQHRHILKKHFLAQRNRPRSAEESTKYDAQSLVRSRYAIKNEKRQRRNHRSSLKKQFLGLQEESKSKSTERHETPSKPQIYDDLQAQRHIPVAEKQQILEQGSWTRLMIAPVKEWLEASQSAQSDLFSPTSSLDDQQSNQNASIDPSSTQKRDLLDRASYTQLMLAPIRIWSTAIPPSNDEGVIESADSIHGSNAEKHTTSHQLPEAQIETTTLQQSLTLTTSQAKSTVSSTHIESMEPQPTQSTSSLTLYAYGGDTAVQQQVTNAQGTTFTGPTVRRVVSKATSIPIQSNTADAHTTYQDLISYLAKDTPDLVETESETSDGDNDVQPDNMDLDQTMHAMPDFPPNAADTMDHSSLKYPALVQHTAQISDLDQTNLPQTESPNLASNENHDARSIINDEAIIINHDHDEQGPARTEMHAKECPHHIDIHDESVYHTSSEGDGQSPMNVPTAKSLSDDLDIIDSSTCQADRARTLTEACDVSFENGDSTEAESTVDEEDSSSISMDDNIMVIDKRLSVSQMDSSLSTPTDVATHKQSSNDISEYTHSAGQVLNSDGTRNTVYSSDQISPRQKAVDSEDGIKSHKEQTDSTTEDPSSTMFSEDATESQLFETINEVSCEVFGLTRPIDETLDSMTTKRRNLVSKLKKTNTSSNSFCHDAQEKWFEQHILPSSPTVLTCNVVLTSDPTCNTDEDAPISEYNDGHPSFDSSLQYNRDLGSTSPLSELSRTPTPPTIQDPVLDEAKSITKRRMTGISIKQSTKRQKRGDHKISKTALGNDPASQSSSLASLESDDEFVLDKEHTPKSAKKSIVRRAGISNHRFPPISAPKFGLLQEKLWQEPFWLIIGVTFLNKTAGRVAAPIFWEVKRRYPTADDLANASESDLHDLVRHLGLQTQRSRRLIKIAKAWSANPPVKARRYRTLHYPVKYDGKEFKKEEAIEGDVEDCAGALEIGHIPGCGPYAWDSWRIFCRDALRAVAEDFNGGGASAKFEPEWKRVVPLDKELKACLRWMWLREGYIWDPETGEKREVTEDERLSAIKGELEPVDEAEAHFTAEARKDVYNTTILEKDE